jgi:hypothetical protein
MLRLGKLQGDAARSPLVFDDTPTHFTLMLMRRW